jgi:transposase
LGSECIRMSQRERDRLVVLRPVLSGTRSVAEAARLLGLCPRQVRRLVGALREGGDAALVHKLRGRPSNRRLDDDLRRRVIGRYRESFADYGPTLASERLSEVDGLFVNAETLRRWLVKDGLWTRHRKRDVHRIRRPRRACFGEMLQVDASHHDWLEGRSSRRVVLVAFIDDATSRVHARFYDGETLAAYFDLFLRYAKAFGLPASLYTDRAGIFRTERRKRETDVEEMPHFARAMEELSVRMLMAHSPQAKGRIERLFNTAQDRWVKGLREAKACSIEAANAVLDKRLIGEFNARFNVTPADASDAHRPCPAKALLDATLCVQRKRVVANDYTVRHDNKVYQLLPPALPGLRGATVVVEERRGGVCLRFKDKYLDWSPASRAAASG